MSEIYGPSIFADLGCNVWGSSKGLMFHQLEHDADAKAVAAYLKTHANRSNILEDLHLKKYQLDIALEILEVQL